MANVPAKQIGWMSAFGTRLDLPLTGNGQALCAETGVIYVLHENEVRIKEKINKKNQFLVRQF